MAGMKPCMPHATPISPATADGRRSTAVGAQELPAATPPSTAPARVGGGAGAVTTPTFLAARAVANSGVMVPSPSSTARS
jgi:hypothetical protein